MRPSDVRTLIHFNTRMSMYITPCDRQGVEAFLAGYECGAGGECRFTEALSQHLAKRHRVKRRAMGWPGQIAQMAERRSLSWMEVYLLASSEVLMAALKAVGPDSPEPGATPDRPPSPPVTM